MTSQQALIDMFRQSFAPLTQLGAGRLALTQAALERDHAAQQYAARRQAALEDHLTGLRVQNQLEGERQLALGKQNAELNRRANQESHTQAVAAKRLDEARALARTLPMPIDYANYAKAGGGFDDEDFINDVNHAAQISGVNGKQELIDQATDLAMQREEARRAFTTLSQQAQLPEAKQVQLALPHLLALAGKDEKKRNEFAGLTTMDAIETALANTEGGDMAQKQINQAIALRQQSLDRLHGPALHEARTNIEELNKQILDLPRGILPDHKKLRSAREQGAASSGAIEKARVDLQTALNNARAGVMAGVTPDEDAPIEVNATGGGRSNLLSIGAGAAGTALLVPGVRKAIATGATRVLPWLARGAMNSPSLSAGLLGYGVMNEINRATDNYVPNSIAGLFTTGFDQQQAQAGREQQMFQARPRLTGTQVYRLRQLGYEPTPELLDRVLAGESLPPAPRVEPWMMPAGLASY